MMISDFGIIPFFSFLLNSFLIRYNLLCSIIFLLNIVSLAEDFYIIGAKSFIDIYLGAIIDRKY